VIREFKHDHCFLYPRHDARPVSNNAHSQ
jgi:hypothetical protein